MFDVEATVCTGTLTEVFVRFGVTFGVATALTKCLSYLPEIAYQLYLGKFPVDSTPAI